MTTLSLIRRRSTILIALTLLFSIISSSETIVIVSSHQRTDLDLPNFENSSPDAILIQNDVDLAVVSSEGIGSANDPYIIRNLNIDCNEIYTAALQIKDTTKHFIVEDCTLSSYYGITIENIQDSTAIIQDNYISNCDNTGIYLFNADGTLIQNNILIDNNIGINIHQNPDTIAINNSISSNEIGIDIYRSININLTDNEIQGGGISVNLNELSDVENLVISSCTVNSKPILFSLSESDLTVSSDYGQIIIINGSDINIFNQDISNVCTGIFLYHGGNYEVSNCNFNSGSCGIASYSVNKLVVRNCIFASLASGLRVFGADNNHQVYFNDFKDNTRGTSVMYSEKVAIYQNNYQDNARSGVFLDKCKSCNIYWNNFSFNGIDSGFQAYDQDSYEDFTNLWYNNITKEGNYWSDYDPLDDNYTVAGNPENIDLYPFSKPIILVPEITISQSDFWGLIISIMTLFVVLNIIKKRKS